jgi:hypothetical protein
MPAIDDIDDSEASFLELMRENQTDFQMIISRSNGHWIVTMKVPSIESKVGSGEGATFSEAWDDVKPSFLEDSP